MPRIRPSHAVGLVGILVAAAIIIPIFFRVTQDCGPRTQDASNIKQIVQATLVYAHTNDGRLPEAEDVRDYAHRLAQSQFFKILAADGGQLTRFDQSGRTSNIHEALPPGTRIGEYVPTPAEQEQWSNANQHALPYQRNDPFRPFLIGGILVIWIGFSAVSFHRYRKGMPGVISIFIWPAIITILLLIFTPSIG